MSLAALCGRLPRWRSWSYRGGALRGSGPYAFIMPMLLAALFYLPWLHNAASALRPLCVAWDLGGYHDYPRWGGHNTSSRMPVTSPCSAHWLLSWGRSSLVYLAPALRFASPRCPKPAPRGHCGRIIPADMSIPLLAHRALWGGAMRYSPKCVE